MIKWLDKVLGALFVNSFPEGIVHNFFSYDQSHILDSNGVEGV